jgi:tRNA threonylcarbamoyl adenosine modification protein (Sua5/YciO/YrdC/YwlC family)
MHKGSINDAIEQIKNGKIIVLPTDTVYGVGVDASNESAVKNLLKIKKRKNNIPILAPNTEQAFKICKNIPDIAYELAKKYWPGALTIVLEKSVNWFLGETSNNTVAVRVPNNKIALEILEKTGLLAVSSANEKTKIEAISPNQAYFSDKISIVVDGGILEKHKSSTIVSCVGKGMKILRQGEIKI